MQSPHIPWIDAVQLREEPAPQPRSFRSLLRRIERRASTRTGRFFQKLTVRIALFWISLTILFAAAKIARQRYLGS